MCHYRRLDRFNEPSGALRWSLSSSKMDFSMESEMLPNLATASRGVRRHSSLPTKSKPKALFIDEQCLHWLLGRESALYTREVRLQIKKPVVPVWFGPHTGRREISPKYKIHSDSQCFRSLRGLHRLGLICPSLYVSEPPLRGAFS